MAKLPDQYLAASPYELASGNLDMFTRWAEDAPERVNLTGPRLAGRTPPPLDQGRFRGNTERAGVFRQLGLDA